MTAFMVQYNTVQHCSDKAQYSTWRVMQGPVMTMLAPGVDGLEAVDVQLRLEIESHVLGERDPQGLVLHPQNRLTQYYSYSCICYVYFVFQLYCRIVVVFFVQDQDELHTVLLQQVGQYLECHVCIFHHSPYSHFTVLLL